MSGATGGRLVVAGLLAHGVDTVFGIPGTHNLEIYRALHGSGIRHVTPRHEQGAGYAADGYARTTGRPGVAIVTTGPALLNIATAVGQAYSDSIPMLVISPGMPLAHPPLGIGYLHETKNQSAALAAVAGTSHRVTSRVEIGIAITQAFAAFAAGRPRPIHLEIPLDLLDAARESVGGGSDTDPRDSRPDRYDPSSDARERIVVPARRAAPALVSSAASALTGARRPTFIVGGGARGAAPGVRRLAERLGAAVLTTTNGKGILPEDHPLAITSALHLPGVNEMIDASDVVLALGTELAPTDFWAGPPRLFAGQPSSTARLIRVDVDPDQLVTNATPDIAILGDCASTVDELLAALGDIPPVPADDRVDRARTAARTRAADSGARWLPWLAAIDAAVAGVDVIYAVDNAMAGYYGALGNLPVRRPGGFCFPTGFGTLGYAVPAGIGAKIANPQAHVIAISGDGGLMFSVQEIATAAAERVSLPIVLFDNGGYGEIRAEMAAAGIPALGVDLPAPDFVKLAVALGGHGATIDTPSKLTTALAEAFTRPAPTLLVIAERKAG